MASTASSGPLQSANYRLLGLVGQGQFGQVYCAIHHKAARLVALKHLNRDRLTTRRFLRELRFLLSLEHPHIVNCYALEQSATGRQLVLDYCEGGTLRSIMEQETQLTLAEILTLVTDILSALEHAHSQRIVHCDIKPENILLSLTPNGWQAKVSDFGIARLNQELRGEHTGATGSPAYMAPERFYHQYAETSDLYAVGIILYELLVGDRPFSGSHTQLMVAHLNHTAQIPDTLPQGVQSLLCKALEKLMARRFNTASEMRAAIVSMRQTLMAAELRERFPKPIITSSVSHFHPQMSVPLAGICQAVCLSTVGSDAPSMLFTAVDNSVYGWSLTPAGTCAEQQPIQQWQLETPVQQVIDCPNGVIAVTHNALYRLAADHVLLPVATFTDPIRVAAGNHRWIMVQSAVTPARFWLVDSLGAVPTTPHLFTVDTPQGDLRGLYLDDRHFLIADVVGQETHLQVITRWGKRLGRLSLQAPLHLLARSQHPNQFLAQSGTHKKDLLVISLKPFRVMRCRLEITADWLGELVIGRVGVSAAGQLQIANFQGQIIGRVDHLPPPTAISFHPPCSLWLATHQGNSPQLHHIDIRELDLEIVF
ncbi:MAG: serine/threonine protein kinase [Leptolyngbya sp. SIO1E4]|nr:serine/threonine protein kinase [Leptolyngbya sp. SIO1E4]